MKDRHEKHKKRPTSHAAAPGTSGRTQSRLIETLGVMMVLIAAALLAWWGIARFF